MAVRGRDFDPISDPPQPEATTYVEGALLRRALSEVGPGRILDVGCGRGRMEPFIRGRTNEYVGIDRSREVLALFRGRRDGAPETVLVRAISERTPFPDRSFAAVVMLRVFHRLTEPDASLREAHRLLRERGRLVLSVMPRPSLFTLATDLWFAVHEPGQFGSLTFARTPRAIVESGANAGYMETLSGTLHRLDAGGFTVLATYGSGLEALPVARVIPRRACTALAGALRAPPWIPSVLIAAMRRG
jgi:SAM-dependent methyltransferase